MQGRKPLAIVFLGLAVLGVVIGAISALILAKGYLALEGSADHAYFRACPTNSATGCTALGWAQLFGLCLGSFTASAALATVGIKKLRSEPDSRT